MLQRLCGQLRPGNGKLLAKCVGMEPSTQVVADVELNKCRQPENHELIVDVLVFSKKNPEAILALQSRKPIPKHKGRRVGS